MNLTEAIKSGRPFRREGWSWWCGGLMQYTTAAGTPSLFFSSNDGMDNRLFLTHEHLTADDWEVQEPEVVITAARLWEAYYRAVDQARAGESIGQHLVWELGLEPRP